MGKRSTFERRPQDRYPTIDPRAVRALLPHLINVHFFAEPCCGAGDLIRELEKHDMVCIMRGDIDYGADAMLTQRKTFAGCDAIITNPPWSRKPLHALIGHFLKMDLQTWLLFDSDWANNMHARPYLPHCSHIVAVGRLLWIEGTTMNGKDNCCWYRFHGQHTKGPHFFGRE